MRKRDLVLEASVRVFRLLGLSALMGLIASAGVRVYAQAPAAQETTQIATSSEAPAAPAPAAATPAVVTETAPVTAAEASPATATGELKASADTKPVNKADAKKDKKKKKEKPPKLTPMGIVQGTLTVDGWTGKARLNYDIADLKFVYVWVPGVGTVVASNVKFPLGLEQQNAFDGNNLTLQANGHTIQISSEKRLMKSKKPLPAWVFVDTVYKASSAYPQMGYGNTKDAPYAWPGAKNAPIEKGGVVAPPPLPVGMRPTIAKPGCVPTTAASGTKTACPAAPAATTPAPAQAPPVPLPGYGSGTTTAAVGASAESPTR